MSDSRLHIVTLPYFQTNSFQLFVLFLCICVIMLVYDVMYLHLLLKLRHSDNKHELIQVIVAANVTTHNYGLARFKLFGLGQQ